ncbi:unnamed protein product [Cylicostephanus goldi]|uniref:Uncharacterized protein n=1 Tax=Cylicostephanus goldi TaxID=71465 RepID=A0A3P6R5I0_CYLGO|nr:unnamed protein product [Cylicostephanus goldi]
MHSGHFRLRMSDVQSVHTSELTSCKSKQGPLMNL